MKDQLICEDVKSVADLQHGHLINKFCIHYNMKIWRIFKFSYYNEYYNLIWGDHAVDQQASIIKIFVSSSYKNIV